MMFVVLDFVKFQVILQKYRLKTSTLSSDLVSSVLKAFNFS